MDRIAEGIVTDIQSNPLLLYLATEMALMETRIKQLEDDGRQHRATIVAQRLELDETNRAMIEMTNIAEERGMENISLQARVEGLQSTIDMIDLRMDTMQNAINAYLFEHTSAERDEMLYFLEQEGRMAGINLSDIVDTDPEDMFIDLTDL